MKEKQEFSNSVFEEAWWLDLVAPGKWSEVIVTENSKVVARLPYVMDKRKIVMPSFTQTLGPWITPEYREKQNGNKHLSRQKDLINQLLEKLPDYKSFNMVFDSSNEYILPYRWHGFRYTPEFSYRLSNLKDEDSLYSSFNKTVKKNIKSARNKTIIIEDSTPEDLLKLLNKTFEAQQRKNPMDSKLVVQIIEKAIYRGNGKIIIAKDYDGNMHSGAFLLYDSRICYYLLGGSDSRFRSSGAQSMVLWEAIRFASTVSEQFDFEGSNIESIENFFRQFNGDRVINYNVTNQTLLGDCKEILKPRVKKLLGYKI